MKRFNVETAVGVFMVFGFLCFAWLSVKLGDVNLFGSGTYSLNARFGSIAGLKAGISTGVATLVKSMQEGRRDDHERGTERKG